MGLRLLEPRVVLITILEQDPLQTSISTYPRKLSLLGNAFSPIEASFFSSFLFSEPSPLFLAS
jgi:hypothetical protein